MNPGCGWIAQFDQFRASMDESLDFLLKIAQNGSESQTEAFLAVLCLVQTLDPEVRAGLATAAIARLAWETQP